RLLERPEEPPIRAPSPDHGAVAIDGVNPLPIMPCAVKDDAAMCHRAHRSAPGSRRIGMAGRRYLLAVVLLASLLHAISISRSLLPAQDGLKFIRIARAFQQDSWPDVVRDTDQHPLYPALIAATEPLIRVFAGT